MPASSFYTEPFFWAQLSMFGMVGATSLFARHGLRHSRAFVAVVLSLVTLGRLVLPLPLCPQPRFEPAGWQWPLGGALLLISLAVSAGPLLRVLWWAPPQVDMQLRNDGIYAWIRHPIYLAELLWPLGLALLCRSVYGVALTPLWWLTLLLHALAEEAELERVLGAAYRRYLEQVRGRFLPGLPF